LSEPLKRRLAVLGAWLVLLVLVALAYRWQLQLGFTDTDGLADVAAGGQPLAHQLTMPLLDGVGGANANFFRPMVNLQNWMLFRLFGWNAMGWQAWDLALHLLCVALLGAVARSAGWSWWSALAAGAIAGLHPLGVDVVPAVARNIDLLLAVFVLLAFLALLEDKPLLASLMGLFALGSKETGLAMMPLLAWLAWRRLGRAGLARTAGPWILGVPAFLLLRQHVLTGLGGYRDEVVQLTGFERVGRSAMMELLLPALSGPMEGLFTEWPAQLGAGLLLTALVGASAWRVRKDPLALGALAAACSPLFIYGVTSVYGRRLLYLPMLGVALYLSRLLEELQLRWVVVVLLAAMLPAVPLVHPDRDWAANDAVTRSVLDQQDALAALPPGTRVWLVDRCVHLSQDPLRASYWREGVGQNNCVGSYSLQAWADSVLGPGHVEFGRFTLIRPTGPLEPAEVRLDGEAVLVQRARHQRSVHRAARTFGFRIEDRGDTLRIRSPEGQPGEHLLVLSGAGAELVQLP
jgi:hypothetical protein